MIYSWTDFFRRTALDKLAVVWNLRHWKMTVLWRTDLFQILFKTYVRLKPIQPLFRAGWCSLLFNYPLRILADVWWDHVSEVHLLPFCSVFSLHFILNDLRFWLQSRDLTSFTCAEQTFALLSNEVCAHTAGEDFLQTDTHNAEQPGVRCCPLSRRMGQKRLRGGVICELGTSWRAEAVKYSYVGELQVLLLS